MRITVTPFMWLLGIVYQNSTHLAKKPPVLAAQVASWGVRTLIDYSPLVTVNFPPLLRPKTSGKYIPSMRNREFNLPPPVPVLMSVVGTVLHQSQHLKPLRPLKPPQCDHSPQCLSDSPPPPPQSPPPSTHATCTPARQFAALTRHKKHGTLTSLAKVPLMA